MRVHPAVIGGFKVFKPDANRNVGRGRIVSKYEVETNRSGNLKQIFGPEIVGRFVDEVQRIDQFGRRVRSEAEKIWKLDAARYGEDYLDAAGGGGPPAGGGQSGGSSAPVQLTEDALAETYTKQHSDDWRYVAPWGQWLTWTGSVWRKEETLQAFELSRQVCRAAARQAASAKLKAKLSSASTFAAVERIARADRRHAETTEVWDRNPWLLNTPAGIVDLQTAAVGPHDRPAYMTKIAAASPQGDCPVWLAFLDTVTGGDVELQRYLQRMAGYCLTGVTTEHALFFLYGTGANGKSVFANTLTAIVGDYATVAAMDMFMASQASISIFASAKV